MSHLHNWQLAELVKGKKIYKEMAVGMSVISLTVGKKPDIARYVCECGESKKVEVKENE